MDEAAVYRISIKATVVDDNGRFLLTLEDTGLWELLGGGLDHGESHLECLNREIKEEAGLIITRVSPTPKYFTTSHNLSSGKRIANVIYEIELKNLKFTPSEECQGLKFFTVEEALKEKLYPNVQEFLKVFDPRLHLKIG